MGIKKKGGTYKYGSSRNKNKATRHKKTKKGGYKYKKYYPRGGAYGHSCGRGGDCKNIESQSALSREIMSKTLQQLKDDASKENTGTFLTKIKKGSGRKRSKKRSIKRSKKRRNTPKRNRNKRGGMNSYLLNSDSNSQGTQEFYNNVNPLEPYSTYGATGTGYGAAARKEARNMVPLTREQAIQLQQQGREDRGFGGVVASLQQAQNTENELKQNLNQILTHISTGYTKGRQNISYIIKKLQRIDCNKEGRDLYLTTMVMMFYHVIQLLSIPNLRGPAEIVVESTSVLLKELIQIMGDVLENVISPTDDIYIAMSNILLLITQILENIGTIAVTASQGPQLLNNLIMAILKFLQNSVTGMATNATILPLMFFVYLIFNLLMYSYFRFLKTTDRIIQNLSPLFKHLKINIDYIKKSNSNKMKKDIIRILWQNIISKIPVTVVLDYDILETYVKQFCQQGYTRAYLLQVFQWYMPPEPTEPTESNMRKQAENKLAQNKAARAAAAARATEVVEATRADEATRAAEETRAFRTARAAEALVSLGVKTKPIAGKTKRKSTTLKDKTRRKR